MRHSTAWHTFGEQLSRSENTHLAFERVQYVGEHTAFNQCFFSVLNNKIIKVMDLDILLFFLIISRACEIFFVLCVLINHQIKIIEVFDGFTATFKKNAMEKSEKVRPKVGGFPYLAECLRREGFF